MAVFESRPYRTPSPRAVSVAVELTSPAVEMERIRDAWEPGQDLTLRYQATLSEEFWAQTGIEPGEDVRLVAIATCHPARMSWRSSRGFDLVDGDWRSELELEVDGAVVAVEVLLDVWIVGPGRTGNVDPARAVHAGAKLWQMSSPTKLKLEDEQPSFPTSAISFERTDRRDVPWSVELAADADPSWSISAAVRLYVNTDSHLTAQIVEGTADDDLFALIEADIHLAVLHRLARWKNSISPAEMQLTADSDHESLAALGASFAGSLGLQLNEALRLADDEPLELTARSREALRFGKKKEEAR